MECGVQSAMISVPPSADPVTNQPLTTFAAADADQAQFEADKRAVYKHPLFPLLALLFERCELATQSSEPQSSDAFNLDIQAFVRHQENDRKPFLANEPEIDGLMIKAIQVLRIHLLELEKVQELCKDFCNRYITCLKGKMQSENLLRSDYPQDVLGGGNGPNNNLINNLENNNNNSMLESGGSASTSPVQYVPQQPPLLSANLEQPPTLPPSSTQSQNYFNNTNLIQNVSNDNLVVHGSTPLSQIGASLCGGAPSEIGSSGPLSPAPTTPGGSADDCDSSDFQSRGGGGSSSTNRNKQKRGVLPKHATSVMRSWLFQHLVHPYPTEDEKRHIAAQTNLTLLQVNNWFINARRRILQPMLDASAPNDGTGNGGGATNVQQGTSPTHKKKKGHNNNRRFWPQDFAAMQPQIDNGILSSSEDEDGDSYSSDGDEGGLVIDAQTNNEQQQQNGHQIYTNNSNNSPEHNDRQ